MPRRKHPGRRCLLGRGREVGRDVGREVGQEAGQEAGPPPVTLTLTTLEPVALTTLVPHAPCSPAATPPVTLRSLCVQGGRKCRK